MPTRPPLAVVGASTRSAACSLLRAGYSVVAADLFADADLRRACPAGAVERIDAYPHGLADWLARTPCAGWLYTGALENHPDLVDRLAEIPPCGETPATSCGPSAIRCGSATSAAHGLPFPKRFPARANPVRPNPPRGDWLHKTGHGPAAVASPLPAGARRSPHRLLATPRRGNPRCGPVSRGRLDRDWLGTTRQLVAAWTGARAFQYCGSLGPWHLPPAAARELLRCGQVLARRFALRGIVGIDFVFDGEQAWPVEVNPRLTASVEVVERWLRTSLAAAHLAACQGHPAENFPPPTEPTTPPTAVGKAILFARQPLTISRPTSDHLLSVAGPFDHPQLADIPPPETHIQPGEPILTLLADGTDLAAVETQLRLQASRWEAETRPPGLAAPPEKHR